MVVHGSVMVEPTETELLLELDPFRDAPVSTSREIDENPELVLMLLA